jgi:uncharacterized membrane protein
MCAVSLATDPVPSGRRHPALRRRRRLRAGAVQFTGIAIGLLAGILLPKITGGPSVGSDRLVAVFAGVGGGLIALIGLVYTLLFLVVQFAATTHSPRLTMFRDSPLVWRGFGLFLGTFAFITTALLATGDQQTVTLLVPIVGFILVLACLAMARALQLHALNSLQLAPILANLAKRGRETIDELYPDPFESDIVSSATEVAHGSQSELRHAIRWAAPQAVLQQIHLPDIFAVAERNDLFLDLTIGVGDTLWERDVIIRMSGPLDAKQERDLLASLEVGIERGFDQDPLYAFRLLNDIALRAISPTMKDPHTAIDAIDAAEGLLRRLAVRQLDVGLVRDSNGTPRVALLLPDWTRFVHTAIDELIDAGQTMPPIRDRLITLLQHLLLISPPSRTAPLDQLLGALTPAERDEMTPTPG